MAEPDTRISGPVLHVCVTCRTGGEALHAALAERAAATEVEVRDVRCLAACAHGCTAAISMSGRWSWLLGRLDVRKADDLLVYAQLYAASASGTVMPSKRPASLGDMVLGRIPSLVHESAS